jgi:AcrR family transcriptional regulator
LTHEQTDLRIRRTQANLREALIDLIEEKGFDAVTVGDIAERAMVNRATFYRHYPDKYALVTGIFEEAITQMLREVPLPEHLEAITSASSAS